MIDNELIDLAAHYYPVSFTVTFVWHNTPSRDTIPSSPAGYICRAPSILTDSDDAMTKRNAPSSPPVFVIGSPGYIDLTEDSNSIQGQELPVPGSEIAPVIIDEENASAEADLRESEGPEELAIIKETNPKHTNNAYRLDYADSDLDEEEQETASQNSPLHEDFNSLYDASEVPAHPSPPPNQPEINWNENDNLEAFEELHRHDEQDTEDSEPENSCQDDHASTDYSDSDSPSQASMGDQENLVEYASTFIVPSAQTITSYEQALAYLGASTDAYDTHIVNLLLERVAAAPEDEDVSRNCVRIIANHRSSSRLWHWVGYGRFAERLIGEEEEEEGEEEEEEEKHSNRNETAITDQASGHTSEARSLSAYDTYLNASCEAGNLAAPESTTSARYAHPYRRPFSPVRSYMGYSDNNRHQLAPIAYTPSYMAPYIPPTLSNGPSSIMQISNLVDSTPMTKLTADNQTTSAQEVCQLDKPRQWNPEYDVRANDSDCPCLNLGRKRNFEEFSGTSAEAVQETLVLDDLLPSPHQHQQLSPIPHSEERTSAILEDTRPDKDNEVVEIEDASYVDLAERGPPPVKKAKLGKSTEPRAGRLRSLASHCLAAAVGAVGFLATIVATTPVQVQEELLQSM